VTGTNHLIRMIDVLQHCRECSAHYAVPTYHEAEDVVRQLVRP